MQPHQIRLRGLEIVSLTALMILAFSASLGMPFNLDAMTLSYAVENSVAGLVVSLEMLSIAIGTLAIGAIAGHTDAKKIYLLGLITIVACNLASIFASNIWILMLLRVPAGLAVGSVVATVMATAARSDRPETTFGIVNSSVGAMGIVISFVLPRALSIYEPLGLANALAGLYVVYVGLSVLAFLFVRSVAVAPPLDFSVSENLTSKTQVAGATRWLSLLGLGILFFGHGQLGVFLVNLGRLLGLDAETIGYVFMFGAVLGVAVPLLSGRFGAQVSAQFWVIGFAFAIVTFALLLAGAQSMWAFAFAAPIYGVLPMAILPVFLGALARIDNTGRLAASHPAFVLVGGAIAPFVGGALIDWGGYLSSALAVLACAIIGSGLMWADLRRSDGLRRASAGIAVPAG